MTGESDVMIHTSSIEQKVYDLASQKALQLGIDPLSFTTLDDLIKTVQSNEGFEPCFRERSACEEIKCCWALLCFDNEDVIDKDVENNPIIVITSKMFDIMKKIFNRK